MSGFSKPAALPEDSDLAGFRSGVAVVDNWAHRHAAHAFKRGTAVVYVSYCGGKPAGFYTLSSHSLRRADIGGGWLKRNSPDQIPAVQLGMMGVDMQFQGSGLGAHLLRDAIIRSMSVAETIGARALVVDPADDDARGFYEHFGFRPIPGSDRLYIPLK